MTLGKGLFSICGPKPQEFTMDTEAEEIFRAFEQALDSPEVQDRIEQIARRVITGES